MKYLSLFSGVGGFEKGIEQACENILRQTSAGQDSRRERGLSDYLTGDEGVRVAPFENIGFSEIDRYARAIYRRHFPDHPDLGDATKIAVSELPDFDLLVGGFPCQAFSVAGKRQGFLDARGTLFFEIARILEYKRPRYFLLENVEGLLSHDDRKTIVAIIRVLSDIGYRVSWQVLNSKDYGLPQNRERIFIAGCFGGERGPEVFPIWEGNGGDSQEIREWSIVRGRDKNTSGCIDTRGVNAFDRADMDKLIFIPLIRIENKSGEGFYNDAHTGAIRANASKNYQTVALSEARSEETKEIRRQRKDKDYVPRRGKVLVPRKDGMIQALNTSPTKDSTLIQNRRIRRLTPTECARLQGFPDDWCDWGIDEKGNRIEISHTQKYRCLGNAVSVNVIEKIIGNWFFIFLLALLPLTACLPVPPPLIVEQPCYMPKLRERALLPGVVWSEQCGEGERCLSEGEYANLKELVAMLKAYETYLKTSYNTARERCGGEGKP